MELVWIRKINQKYLSGFAGLVAKANEIIQALALGYLLPKKLLSDMIVYLRWKVKKAKAPFLLLYYRWQLKI